MIGGCLARVGRGEYSYVLERKLLECPTFRGINGTALTVLLDLLGKRVMAKRPNRSKRDDLWDKLSPYSLH